MIYDPCIFELPDGTCGFEGKCPHRTKRRGCYADNYNLLTEEDYQVREYPKL